MNAPVFGVLVAAALVSAGDGQIRYRWDDPLNKALHENQTEQVLKLIDRQPALLNAVSLRTKPSSHDGYTPLHEAAWRGNVALIEGLHRRGAKVDMAATQEVGNGFTPL